MMDKPIEFTIPCSKLCEFESVKNFTRLDGSIKTFIEKSAYDKLKASNKALSAHLSSLIKSRTLLTHVHNNTIKVLETHGHKEGDNG